jgi:hypothetical protein
MTSGLLKEGAKKQSNQLQCWDYNQCLGGVDLEDQLLHSYLIERKRMDMLYIKLLHRLLNKILNSLMIYRNNVAKIIDQLSLRIKLVEGLFVKYAMC